MKFLIVCAALLGLAAALPTAHVKKGIRYNPCSEGDCTSHSGGS
ncbi:hypothetical protein PTTW11_11363 [Pyrenophora teres f. teres]|uniref:Uncharacterized protein n=1 Tax=Pyrenophora teres f. teres TaxID=97479 RepID=A0A6S6WIG1_9PLEO|nr:hypothetical protein PTTW11_11363 [Pyrenophora teres f. teres]